MRFFRRVRPRISLPGLSVRCLMFRKVKGVLVAVPAAASTALLPVAAFAQSSIDTSSVVSFLDDDVKPAVAAVAGGFLLLAVLFAGYRWVRGAAGGN